MRFYVYYEIVIVLFCLKMVWAFYPTNPQLFLRWSNVMLKNRSCAAFFYKICMIMGLLMCLIRLTYYRFWVWLVFHILGGRSMYVPRFTMKWKENFHTILIMLLMIKIHYTYISWVISSSRIENAYIALFSTKISWLLNFCIFIKVQSRKKFQR